MCRCDLDVPMCIDVPMSPPCASMCRMLFRASGCKRQPGGRSCGTAVELVTVSAGTSRP